MQINYNLDEVTIKDFRLNNFATGSYFCKCSCCGKEFTGDKLAMFCLECALVYEENMNAILNEKMLLVNEHLQKAKTIIEMSKQIDSSVLKLNHVIEMLESVIDVSIEHLKL
jgi:hypothetical protein